MTYRLIIDVIDHRLVTSGTYETEHYLGDVVNIWHEDQ